ncbi:copper chaperone PCu(A)C [Rhodoferax sp. WC2427]|uniref:copper chaperone PCu(A)C n=1 Tax=Rhodoferax sp. WC2427 TaxID=3234144 RepID=UPI0034654991
MKFVASLALLVCASGLFVQSSYAQNVEVKDAWVRASVQGQKASGAFMTLTAKADARLVSVSTPVAGVAQVHEMKMEGDVMRMRAVAGGLALPAGQPVALTPGGFHVMLMDLKAALPKDSTVPMTLVFQDAKGVQSTLELKLPVATVPPGGMGEHKH